MRILYVGRYEDGSTSKMRGEYLKRLLQPAIFKVVNISIPLENTFPFWRSIGWRYKWGPLIKQISDFVDAEFNNENYDLIWVDKGLFIKPEIIEKMRKKTPKLIHFTPDPAFLFHQSKLFFNSIKYYDCCVTTKTFEIELYKKAGAQNVIFCTQGFDPEIHTPEYSFEEKEKSIVFIGHAEPERFELISHLIENGISIHLAGIKWEKLIKKYKHKNNFYFHGKGVYKHEYARLISHSAIGLGLMSKWIPEKHTTRTFEIPACGTCLFSEQNEEIDMLFNEDEIVRFKTKEDLLEKIEMLLAKPQLLKSITDAGYKKVYSAGYDYPTIMKTLVQKIGLL